MLDLDQLDTLANAIPQGAWLTVSGLVYGSDLSDDMIALIVACNRETVLALTRIARASQAVIAVEDLYRTLDKETRRAMLDGFEVKHREAMDELRAALASVGGDADGC